MNNPNEQITLVLPLQFVNLVLDALADRKLREVAECFSIIQRQRDIAQMKAQTPPPEPPATE